MLDDFVERKKMIDADIVQTQALINQMNEQRMQLRGQLSVLKAFEQQMGAPIEQPAAQAPAPAPVPAPMQAPVPAPVPAPMQAPMSQTMFQVPPQQIEERKQMLMSMGLYGKPQQSIQITPPKAEPQESASQ